MKAKQLSIGYVKDFTTRISECKDIDEYYDLVGGVFIFAELVDIHFRELYEMDADKAETMLLDLRTSARFVAEEITESTLKIREEEKPN